MATWGDFATALCGAVGAPASSGNVDAFLGWFLGEQAPESPNAAFNPLNIQAGDFPHVGVSGSGQYDFASFDDGVRETAAFIGQGFYTGIVAALRSDAGCYAVLVAVEQSPWAEGHYGYALHDNCATVGANPGYYMAGQIAGVGGPTTPVTSPVTPPKKTPSPVRCAAPFTF